MKNIDIKSVIIGALGAALVIVLVGALAGAHNGLKAIPADWIEKVRQPDGTCLHFTQGLDTGNTGM